MSTGVFFVSYSYTNLVLLSKYMSQVSCPYKPFKTWKWGLWPYH